MDAATDYDASSPHFGGPDSESTTGEIITRLELDTAYICEKLSNLNFLSMRVEIKEGDFEAFVSDKDPDLVINALEYGLLSGFLDSEVKLLETYIRDLDMEIINVITSLMSSDDLGGSVTDMVGRLHDNATSLEQPLEQVLEIQARSANFEKNVLRLYGGEDHTESLNNIDQGDLNMQNVEHQRDVLKRLNKSLEREIDLDKRVCELTQVEETLTMRLRSLEQEAVYAKEEAETALEMFYETDHTSELLMQTTKVLISKIKMLQFNLEGSIQREAQLQSDLLKLERFTEEEASTAGSMEMMKTIEDLKAKIIKSEDKCRELKDTNEKVVLLEKELSDVKLMYAEACYEAREEEKDKRMFVSSMDYMSNVIRDLKNRLTQGKLETESMEDRCASLSKSKAGLKKELKSVKSKVKRLKRSLHQMEETKKASARNINVCSKYISDLVMQMTLERKRLQKQMSSLKQGSKILVNRLKKTDDDPAENKEALSTNFEVEKETVTDSTVTARDIDARQLKTKYILLILFIIIIPLFGVFLYQTQVR